MFIVDDGAGGTNRKTAASRLKTYIGGGITEADQWRITANLTNLSSNAVITANWERNDTDFDKIGNGMTESSGIFTFPTTGIYLVSFAIMVNGAATNYALARIKSSTNSGTSFVTRTEAYTAMGDSSDYSNASCNVMIDVTNASTFRVRFEGESQNAITYLGNTNQNNTWVNFIRLGDT